MRQEPAATRESAEGEQVKLVITVCDLSAAACAGGDPQRESFVFDVPTDALPLRIRESAEGVARADSRYAYVQVSFSLLAEKSEAGDAP